MTNLYKIELRKLFTNRLSLLSIAAVFLLSFLFSFSTLQSMYAYDGKNREGSGKAAVAIDKALTEEYAGTLTDEKVQKILSDFRPTSDLHGLNAAYLYQNALQSSVFARFSDIDGSWNGLHVTDVFGEEEIKIGFVKGWLCTSQDLTKVFTLLSLVILLLTAPVFSGEYGGMDGIILTTRYGKTKCAAAKAAAGLTAAVLVTLSVAAFHLLFALTAYGTDGLDCSVLFAPMEFTQGYLRFPITCAEMLIYQLVLGLMSAVSVTGITLLLSSVCRNPLITLAASAAVYFLPLLLPVSETSSLYRLWVLTPVYYSQYISLMSVEQMTNGMLYAVWSIPAGILIMSAGALLSPRIFARHQVS